MSEHLTISNPLSIISPASLPEIKTITEHWQHKNHKLNYQNQPLQFKLEVGSPDDPLEYEADQMADKIMRMPEENFIQRKCSDCKEEDEKKIHRKPLATFIQRKESSSGDKASYDISNQIDASRGRGSSMNGDTHTFMQNRFGVDFSGVKIHSGSEAIQMNRDLNAKAFTVGNDIYFNEGQYNPDSSEGKLLLAHELTHTVQQSDPGKITPKTTLIQRAIRINGGAQKINEKDYQVGGPKENIGSKFKVQNLLADATKRVFNDTPEVENYANGATDYIGDVKPLNKKIFWYRLPANDLTVLGEQHNNPEGNVEDIIIGLDTKRFMYEPFHEFQEIQPLKGSIGAGTNTNTTLLTNEQKYRVGPLADYVHFSPALENIVIKAFTGASMYKEFLGSKSDAQWASRKVDTDYSFGDRIALYFSFAIHVASDIADYTFPAKNSKESHYIKFGRLLQTHYKKNKTILDAFSAIKDADNLIGIAELYKKFKSPEKKIYSDFADIFEKFAAGYIEELGVTMGNTDLTKEGEKLFKKKTKDLDSFSPAREEIIKERVKIAKAGKYLIAGMGDAHHTNLTAWLDTNSIAHVEVAASLIKQESDVSGKWVP
ncbi:MAG: DUF4157 domain-containing protein [Chitinophagales bacterium]